MNKKRISRILLFLGLGISLSMPTNAIAQNSCQVKRQERTLVSAPISNLDEKIQNILDQENLKGEVTKIVWAEGIQAYNFTNGKPSIFAPSAELFSLICFPEDLYVFSNEKIGSHYKTGDRPAWEFDSQRYVAQEISKIQGADEKLDAPWLLIKTDVENQYIVRLETRGGVPSQHNCQDFDGFVGLPYQTLYVFVETNTTDEVGLSPKEK